MAENKSNPAPTPQTLPGAPPAPTPTAAPPSWEEAYKQAQQAYWDAHRTLEGMDAACEHLRPRAERGTVAEYFGDATDYDLLARLTDGVLDEANPACKRFNNWSGLREDCREAIQRYAKVPLTDRRVLYQIMDEATRLSARRGGYPKPWLKVMSDLRRGGPLLGNTGPEPGWSEPESAPVWEDPNPLCFPWLHSLFKNAVRETNADFSPWKEHLEHTSSARADASYRDGWRFIHNLLTGFRKVSPAAPLVAVRDWLWEHDAAPEKPATPPWDTPAKP